MTDKDESGKKGLFVGSELHSKMGLEKEQNVPLGNASKANDEIPREPFGQAERVHPHLIPEEHRDWETQKSAVLQAAEDVHCTVLDGEAVLLNLENGHYYSLNRVGSAIWEHCDGKRTLEEILHEICQRFDVGEDRARGDLLAITSQLLKEELLFSSQK